MSEPFHRYWMPFRADGVCSLPTWASFKSVSWSERILQYCCFSCTWANKNTVQSFHITFYWASCCTFAYSCFSKMKICSFFVCYNSNSFIILKVVQQRQIRWNGMRNTLLQRWLLIFWHIFLFCIIKVWGFKMIDHGVFFFNDVVIEANFKSRWSLLALNTSFNKHS